MAVALEQEQPKVIAAIPAYSKEHYIAKVVRKAAEYKVRGYAGRLVVESTGYVYKP